MQNTVYLLDQIEASCHSSILALQNAGYPINQMNNGFELNKEFTISKCSGDGKVELVEVVKWSEDCVNIYPPGHCSVFM